MVHSWNGDNFVSTTVRPGESDGMYIVLLSSGATLMEVHLLEGGSEFTS